LTRAGELRRGTYLLDRPVSAEPSGDLDAALLAGCANGRST
jgi:hypothetical protein